MWKKKQKLNKTSKTQKSQHSQITKAAWISFKNNRKFKNKKGKKWLNNAIIWIYRKQFTLKEINQLIKFYKSSAGQKMTEKFPILMLQSLKAGEEIKEHFVQQLKKDK